MSSRRKIRSGTGEPLRWRITERNGNLSVVLVNMAPPLSTGESLVWEGAARHMTEAYQAARSAGLPVVLTKDGFRLRVSRHGAIPNPG